MLLAAPDLVLALDVEKILVGDARILEHLYIVCDVHRSKHVVRARDENGAETDGTGCYHICFHIFLQKRKRIQKQILPETDTERIQSGHGNKTVC